MRFAVAPVKINLPDLDPDLLALCQRRFNIDLPPGLPNQTVLLVRQENWIRLPEALQRVLNERAGRYLHSKLETGAADPGLLSRHFDGPVREALIKQPGKLLAFLQETGALDDPKRLRNMSLAGVMQGMGVSARVAFSYMMGIRRAVAAAAESAGDLPAHGQAETIAGEIRRIVGVIVPTDAKDHGRTIGILCARYGSNGEEASTLQAVGDKYGLTRERVRQIQAKFIERASYLRPASTLYDRFRAAISPSLPGTVTELEQSMTALLGEGQSLEGAGRFGREVLGIQPGFTICAQEQKTLHRRVVATGPEREPLSREAKQVRHACIQMISACGAAQVHIVQGMVQGNGGGPFGGRGLLTAISNIKGMRWLDQRTGWFWLTSEAKDNSVHTAVMKIFAVSGRRLDVEEIYAAVVRSLRKRYADREPNLRVLMPPWVLSEMLKQTDFLKVVQKEYFELRESRSHQGSEDVLSPTERFVFEYMRSHGNVASRMELRRAYGRAGLGGEMALQMMLGYTPILYRVERAVYALVGRDIDIKGLARARKRSGVSRKTDLDPQQLSVKDATFTITLTEAAMRNHCIAMPAPLARLVEGRQLTCYGALEGLVRIQNTRMSGMAPLLRKASLAQQGASIRFRLDPARHEIFVEKL